jgi:Adenylate kinase and related kinases
VNILLLGPQGSGKGTQAKRLAEEYGLAHVSTGDILREEIEAGTELGKEVEPILASGGLVPDATMISLIRERLQQDDAQNGFVLDGFPRTQPQAEALDKMLREIERPLTVVFALDISDESSKERLLKRAEREGREDDTPEVIERRLRTYREQTEPLIEHYRTRGNLVTIHADRPIDAVFAEIQKALDHVEARK